MKYLIFLLAKYKADKNTLTYFAAGELNKVKEKEKSTAPKLSLSTWATLSSTSPQMFSPGCFLKLMERQTLTLWHPTVMVLANRLTLGQSTMPSGYPNSKCIVVPIRPRLLFPSLKPLRWGKSRRQSACGWFAEKRNGQTTRGWPACAAQAGNRLRPLRKVLLIRSINASMQLTKEPDAADYLPVEFFSKNNYSDWGNIFRN